MTHVRLLIVVALFGTATQLVLSQDSRVVQNGARQTKMIGADRLVSVEPLPQMDGPMCDADEARGAANMIAAAATNPPMILAGFFTVSPCFDFVRSSHRGHGIVN